MKAIMYFSYTSEGSSGFYKFKVNDEIEILGFVRGLHDHPAAITTTPKGDFVSIPLVDLRIDQEL